MLGTGLAISMFYRLIRDHGPLFAGMVTYLVPVGAVMWGWADAERVTATQLVALAGVFISVAVVQYGAARGLGQLSGVEIPPCRDAKERFTRLYLGRAMRWGDIKCSALVDSVTETELEALIS